MAKRPLDLRSEGLSNLRLSAPSISCQPDASDLAVLLRRETQASSELSLAHPLTIRLRHLNI